MVSTLSYIFVLIDLLVFVQASYMCGWRQTTDRQTDGHRKRSKLSSHYIVVWPGWGLTNCPQCHLVSNISGY